MAGYTADTTLITADSTAVTADVGGNQFLYTRHKVVGLMQELGASPVITVNGDRLVDLSLNFATGSFVGTVAIQRKASTGLANVDGWDTIASYTTSTELTFVSRPTQYRVNVLSLTSGTLYFELTAGNTQRTH